MQLTLSYIYYFLVHAFLLGFECVIKLIASNFFRYTHSLLRHLVVCISIHLNVSHPFAFPYNYSHEYLCLVARTFSPECFGCCCRLLDSERWWWCSNPAVVLLQEHTQCLANQVGKFELERLLLLLLGLNVV